MAYVTGMLVLDAPASALNNAGLDQSAATENRVLVKKLWSQGSPYAYVTAQAFRYWLRTTLEHNDSEWKASPVHAGDKISFPDGNPITYWDDDLFGYMRAPKGSDKDGGSFGTGLEQRTGKKTEFVSITRLSPLRVSTFVSIGPSAIVDDFGTMTRQEGNPVIHQHEFYRAHLRGLLSLDLTSCGTFYDAQRVGYKNLDENRRKAARERDAEELTVRKQKAFRLPLPDRRKRVSTLVQGLANLNGGAKQTLHYTDLTPAVVVAAVTKGGNHPFYRMFSGSRNSGTELHEEAAREIFTAFRDEFLSPVYIGWAHGFLDKEREKLTKLLEELPAEAKPSAGFAPIAHPRAVLLQLAEELASNEHADWYA